MARRRSLLAVLVPFLAVAVSAELQAEAGFWKRTGEARFEKARVDRPTPGRYVGFEASGGEGQLAATGSWDDINNPGRAVHRSTARFTWSFDKSVATLTPGDKITVTATLGHDSEGSANAGIAIQPPGMPPGTFHESGLGILAGFDNTANRSVTRSAQLVIPEGSRYAGGRMELRFEIHTRYSAAVYYTYEWVAAPPPPPPVKETPKPKTEVKKPAPPRPAPGRPDLHIDPDSIALTQTTFGTPGWWHSCGGENDLKILAEPSADQQAITVRIANRSTAFAAKDVQLVVTAQRKGESGRTPGLEMAVGDIPPGGKTDVRTHIDLEGENVESATLFFRVYTPGVEDVNGDDNEAGVEFSVYYAARDGRGFSVFDDTYAFPNYGWEERAGEELLEGVLATLAGGLRLDANALAVMQRMWFASTYADFAVAAAASAMEGMGGHCYGMAATAALYFEDPGLKPVPKSVPEMLMGEASYNNNLYHRAQLLPVFGAIADQKLMVDLFPSPRRCYEDVKASLRDERRALILGFTNDWDYARSAGGPMRGHAVLAYKLVEVSGRNPVIYIYDSNFPAGPYEDGRVLNCGMEGIEIDPGRDVYSIRGEYNWASRKHISAFRPHREMPLDATSTRVINALKEVYAKMIDHLDMANAIMAILRCPADALFTDEKGLRTGVREGRVYQEIPGSKVVTRGEVEIYHLPKGGRYSLDIRGTGQGRLGFDLISPAGPGEARLVSFGDIPVGPKSMLAGTIEPETGLQSFAEGGRTHKPSIVSALKDGKASRSDPPARRPESAVPGVVPLGGAAAASSPAETYEGIPASRKRTIFEDDFDDNRGKWPVGKIDLGTMDFRIKGGAYILRAVEDQGKLVYRDDIPLDEKRDFEIEARLRHVAGTENMGHFLFWGRSADAKSLQFGITGNGHFQVLAGLGATFENVIPWTKSELVKKDVPNTLTVRKVGRTYYFFLNGSLVHRMPFRPFAGRQIGFMVAKKATVSVDSLRISYLD